MLIAVVFVMAGLLFGASTFNTERFGVCPESECSGSSGSRESDA